MKKIQATLLLLLFALCVNAIPAKKGIWKTLSYNGVSVEAQLVGDEHMHYWLTRDGQRLAEDRGVFVPANVEKLSAYAAERRAKAAQRRVGRLPRKAIGDFFHYTGQKKGLIILVEFTDQHFRPENDSLRYTRICNEENYSEGRFRGSVYDYFKAQSYGEFSLKFDVVGPVQMDTTYYYYGHDANPAESGSDAHPGEMTAKACMAVDSLVNFPDYDWDGDGFVDQVMCIYAGEGQATGGSAGTIWPHEWDLESSDYGSPLELDGVKINTYACANERQGNSIMGIGTICHEFSHCLGLPDMYDIEYGGNFGMGEWSLMDTGSYNGDGFCPSGYSSFDKYTCGWVKPVELETNVRIDEMKPLEDAPEVYMVRNKAYADEYFLLENRQQKGWDAESPGSGMLILHVDYDRTIWEYNLVNTNYPGGGGYPMNDHQRCTIFHAGNTTSSFWYGPSPDPYPYEGNDSLTNTSLPAAILYNENNDGNKLMNVGIMEITKNDNGTMAFRFRNTAEEVYVPDGTLFYDSFNNCVGTGGNDGQWSVNIASSTFVPDCEGWETVRAYGGYSCARFGNGSTPGLATTPAFDMETNDAYLSFKAAGWNKDGTTLSLSVEGDGIVEPATVELENFAWNEYKVKLHGNGQLKVTFSPEKRCLLDEVLVVSVKADPTNAVTALPQQQGSNVPAGYYTLDGSFAGTTFQALPRGIYVMYSSQHRKGKKIVK